MANFELGTPLWEWSAVKLCSIVGNKAYGILNRHIIAFQRKVLIGLIMIVTKGSASAHLVK